jgi:hypothetical protein
MRHPAFLELWVQAVPAGLRDPTHRCPSYPMPDLPGSVEPVVTSDPAEAHAAVSAGQAVVLIVAPGATAPSATALAAEGGRLAVLVGDPSDDAVWEAALEMDRGLHRELDRRPGG